MSVELDAIDRQIIHHLCGGIYSYDELTENIAITRDTLNERLKKLEDGEIIEKKIMAIPNFSKLNLSAICVGLEIDTTAVDKAVEILKDQPRVKFVWKTYGTYNLNVVFICIRGGEGDCINKLRLFLEKAGIRITHIALSVSYSWDKVDLNPF
jgi:DNA-binding Lrp family transcriptional regulator